MKFGFQKEKEAVEKMGRTVAGCPFRTKYHIMPPVGWLNDPNGLCQFRGIYHAYFQYSPLNVNGGGGYWGHCTSRDMLHWEYQDPVLTADTPEDEDGVYSGSALVEDDRMYLFYTGNVKKPGDYDYIDQGRVSTQILVESGDGQQMSGKIKLLGMEDYPDSMTQHIRDPKVWKEEGQYFMVLGARERAWDESGERADRGGILIYRSGDRKNWTLERSVTPEQRFGYMWECPDIFELGGERFLSFCPQGLPSGSERYQNIYQSVKGMTAAEATVKEGGVIIMLSKCNDGHGGKVFYETFRDEKNLQRMMDTFIATPPTETIIDQWQSQIFARLLMRATVVFVSDAPDDMVSDLHMVQAHSMEEALAKADEILAAKGIKDGSILSIPDGVSVMVV